MIKDYNNNLFLIDKKGVVKDTSIYRAKVIALNDGHGYVLVYKNGSDEKHHRKRYENALSSPEAEIDRPVVADNAPYRRREHRGQWRGR